MLGTQIGGGIFLPILLLSDGNDSLKEYRDFAELKLISQSCFSRLDVVLTRKDFSNPETLIMQSIQN